MSRFQKPESISDIAKKYKETESCSEEFKKTLLKSVKFGFYSGIIFGTYIAFRFVNKFF